jgi:streptomycin 6-kinase
VTSVEPSFPSHWNLTNPVLIAETFSSRIWKVSRRDGTVAVVKDLKLFDDVADELRGAHLLDWRQGEGAVKLFGFEGRQMLLEYGGDRLLLRDLEDRGDAAATDIAAEAMTRLHSPSRRPLPPDLQPLRDRFVALFRVASIDRDAGIRSLYVEAAEIADRRLASPHDIRPLHGDVHHENILYGPRSWLMIDPKGVLGDPAFDAANMFYNPLDRDDLCLDPERIAAMAAVFARTLRQDPAAILDHAIAYGCLSAAWHREDANAGDEGRELAIVSAIRAVRAQF